METKELKERFIDEKTRIEVEKTGAKNIRIEELKKITNYQKAKQVLNELKYELSEVPKISDIKKVMLNMKAELKQDYERKARTIEN